MRHEGFTYSGEGVDNPRAWQLVERDLVYPSPSSMWHSRFRRATWWIGTHVLTLPIDAPIPEVIHGSHHHGYRKVYDWCRGDGAFFTGLEKNEVKYPLRSHPGSHLTGRMWSGTRSWIQGEQRCYKLIVQAFGEVEPDPSLNDTEFLATELRVLGYCWHIDYVHRIGCSWLTPGEMVFNPEWPYDRVYETAMALEPPFERELQRRDARRWQQREADEYPWKAQTFPFTIQTQPRFYEITNA